MRAARDDQSRCDRAISEEPVPFRRNPARTNAAAALDKCEPYAVQGFRRRLVQAFGGDDHEAPVLALEFFPPFDVAQPVCADIGMVPPVVLDDKLESG
jgi:hypothetical protein